MESNRGVAPHETEHSGMDRHDGETIFALASAPGRAGVAVMRLSGPAAGTLLRQLTGSLPEPRRAELQKLKAKDGRLLDQALVLWFPAPESFTGEDVAELHLHGSRAVIDAVSGALAETGLARPAEAGEFTRRAFVNHKLDLTEVEGLADLIAAETESQRREAVNQLTGSLSRQFEGLRQRMVNALALLEASIDFSDEDLPEDLIEQVRPELEEVLTMVNGHLADTRRGELVRDGFQIAVIGEPNAGKSSLMNAIVDREVSIVTPIAGTTRDIVEARIDLGGHAVILADTAGLRSDSEVSQDSIEVEGMKRARLRAEEADLVLRVVDASSADHLASPDVNNHSPIYENEMLVLSKSDLWADDRNPSFSAAGKEFDRPVYPVSSRTGDGFSALLLAIQNVIGEHVRARAGVAPNRQRHRLALEECAASIQRSFGNPVAELAIEDVRIAVRALGRITGRVDVEELLDVIFSQFCIGK